MQHNITVISGGNAVAGQCVSDEQRQRALTAMNQSLRPLLLKYLDGSSSTSPCSGPGWRRIAYYDMTGSNSACPLGLSLTSYSKRTCGRTRIGSGCSSTTFSVGGSEYSQVCGRIRGYQVGSNTPFRPSRSLENTYVNGVSLTHGARDDMQHVWTFAFGISCPCETVNSDHGDESEESEGSDSSNAGDGADTSTPSFLLNDYFCESRSSTNTLYEDDPLWDGQGCTSTSTCCQFNNPPWFTKNLPNPTTDNIELRLCSINRSTGTPIDLIELYVK